MKKLVCTALLSTHDIDDETPIIVTSVNSEELATLLANQKANMMASLLSSMQISTDGAATRLENDLIKEVLRT